MISIGSLILWYIAITLVGWIAFPIAYRLLPALPDRGYTLSRPLGLLAWGFIFWLLASLGVLQNAVSGVVLALILLAGVAAWSAWGGRWREIWGWVHDQKKLVLVAEGLFLACFVLWAIVRAYNPDISGTEKPMELAFINAILRSPAFPPNDPWLSGYAISYYYFGYVIVTLLIRVTGVDSGIAFNLAIALWFALTALGAYGLLFNLYRIWQVKKGSPRGLYSLPILGPLFVLIVSNLEGILEFLRSWGLFWQTGANGVLQSSFWTWLNIPELSDPPPAIAAFPSRPAGVLWWRASRVVQDFTYTGASREIIDEFPFFSYLLGDLHPHVLAMPFVLLAIGLALNLFLGGSGGQFEIFHIQIPLSRTYFLLSVVAMGGLAFMNTWDFPFYLILFCGAYVLSQYLREGWHIRRITEFLSLLIFVGFASVVIYLPFYVGFQSQAGTFIPSLVFMTRGTYFWVMFAPLLIPILLFMVYIWKDRPDRRIILRTAGLVAILIIGLLALSFIFAYAISLLPNLGGLFLNAQGAANGIGPLLAAAFKDRITSPGTWITLGILLSLVLALIYRPAPPKNDDEEEIAEASPAPANDPRPVQEHPHAFIFLLVLVGGLLALFPEFFYLQDQFGWRINTIFKFYFETWILWGLAAAYGIAVLLQKVKSARGNLALVGTIAVVVLTVAYPVMGLWSKTGGFKPATGATLDGNAFVKQFNPDDWAGIQWLQSAPVGVVAEAVGGDYTDYARVSTRSGDPTVLGWPGHVSQWRGGATEMGSRETDIKSLYEANDWQTALKIIQEYNIRYIYVGDLEHSTYRVNAVKFDTFLTTVFKQGNVTIYEVPDQLEAHVTPAQSLVGTP